MTGSLKYRIIVLLPLFCYRYALGATSKTFLGIKSNAYLIIFCVLSLAILSMEIFIYSKKRNYKALNIKGYFDIALIIFFSLCIVGYCIYTFYNEGWLLFLIAGFIYLMQSIFFGMIFFREKRNFLS